MKKPKTVVLVVEDEPTVRALAVSIIEDERDYASLSAATGREAVALLEQDQPIDLLFADINLPDGPDGMDGLELARRAVEMRPGLGVIYTSGGGQTDGMAALFVSAPAEAVRRLWFLPLGGNCGLLRRPPLELRSAGQGRYVTSWQGPASVPNNTFGFERRAMTS